MFLSQFFYLLYSNTFFKTKFLIENIKENKHKLLLKNKNKKLNFI